MSDRKQLISINGYNDDLMPANCSVPQGSVLGPFLFLIYINNLHKAIQHCNMHQFADDTNLFHTNKSVKISLNVEKTELVIFKSPRKVLTEEVN